MKLKEIFKSSLLLLILLMSSCKGKNENFVKTSGTSIVDPMGNELIWRGIGLGGYMLQEGYMYRTSGPQYKIEQRLEELIGVNKKEAFYNEWYQNHLTKADVDSLASWGFNSIRLPMHYQLFTPAIEEETSSKTNWNPKGFELVDQLIDWCKQAGIYLILDLHAAPGGQGVNADINDYNPDKPSLWESALNQDKLVALWKKIANRYRNEPTIAAYDLINEPNWGFVNHQGWDPGCDDVKNTLLWDLQKRITQEIRTVDQNHIIVIEGNCWGNNYRGLGELWDDNLVFSFHKYWNGNTQADIQHMIDFRDQRQVPIWLGESGENSNTWFTNCIALLENNNIGWAWWPLKKMGINNPLEIVIPEGYVQLTSYWTKEAEKPSEQLIKTTLNQLIENLNIKNNIVHIDVIDAMIRQPHSDVPLPFKKISLEKTQSTLLQAADYDLGKNGVAYFDLDASNTTGKAGGAQWNLGKQYRNDGVDIGGEKGSYYVGWTQKGEWLLYTFNVKDSADYQITLHYSSEKKSNVEFSIDSSIFLLSLNPSDSKDQWSKGIVGSFNLSKGSHQMRIKFLDKNVKLSQIEFN